jgi:hypothetical protein
MESKQNIRNNLLKQNIDRERNSNIVGENKRNESDYSYGRDPDMLQQDEEKSKNRQKTESAYSYGKDPDSGSRINRNNKQKAESADSYRKDYDNALESGSRFNNTKNLWIPGSNNRLDILKEWQEKDLTSSGRTNHSYADINDLPTLNATKPRKQSNRCRIIQVVGVVLVLAVLGVITFFIVRNFSSKGIQV